MKVQRNPSAPTPNKQGEIDLMPMVQRLIQKWYIMAGAVALCVTLAWVYVRVSPLIFEVQTTMLLADQSSGSVRAEELLQLLDIKDKGIRVEDEIGIIKSFEMVKRTMERLDFAVSYFEIEDNIFNRFTELQVRERYQDFPFHIMLNPAANQMVGLKLRARILNQYEYELSADGKDVKVYNLQSRDLITRLPSVNFSKRLRINKPYQDENLNFKLVLNDEKPKPGSEYFFVINDLNALTSQYMAKIEAKPIERNSRILSITSQGAIVEKEMRFLNTLVDVLIESDLGDKNKTGLRTLQFIDSQLAKIGDSLRNSESALSTFRSRNQVLNINEATNNIYQKHDQLESEKSRLEVQLKYYQNVLSNLANNRDMSQVVSPSTVGIDNPILNSLLLEIIDLHRQYVALNVVAKRDAPNVKVIESKMANSKSTLTENLTNNVNAARIALAETNRRISELEGNIYRMPENERRLIDLQGKTQFNSKTYNFMLEKRTEAAVTMAANTPDMKRVDEAKMVGTGPKYPKTAQIYMIAVLLGLILPAGILIARDKMDDTIRSKEDLESLTSIPFIGYITDAGRAMKLPVVEKPLSGIAESFRSVRVNLQYLAAGMDKKVIGVTSSISGEGKTFCSANLSADIAMGGKRVLLIEADMRRPTLNKYFTGLDKRVGLSSVLIKSATLEEAIQHTEIKNLDIISSGPIPPNPLELVSLPAMKDLIDKAKGKYDYVVLDIPPIGFVSEYFVLLDHIDANIFITRFKYTSRNLLDNIDSLYREGKIDNLYMVLNGLNFYQKYEYRNKGHKYYRA